ncbi:Heat shock protein 9/12 [Penicillium alfredii]|uniref:Heat shock protein 9/12 n=1 Tax=Penicillium alfredii TaxID=1506179 RepID=A0A9W9JZ55_9EURO|nr:Heat shock protein 9/12 [Penicillium alfredii]KAJ5086865.1 Heat shock protein 9/12 [Penicillium alfredii]
MSDTARKDFTTKAKEEITPDSTKSTQDKVKEAVTDTSDRVTRGFQTDDSKGGAQEAFDKTQRAYDNHAHGGASNSIGDKVKDALGFGGNN